MASMLRPVLLNNGCLMPRIGVGTYQILGEKCQEIVTRAIEIGYRHIDTAQMYSNEKDVGSALKNIERSNLCKRDKLFITTKLASTNMDPKIVRQSVERSLEDLNLKYVDLFLIHTPWPLKYLGPGVLPVYEKGQLEYENVDLRETWAAVEQVVKDGLAKSVGLSNFTEKQISSILSVAKICPQNVQLECHLYLQQNRLRSFLSDKGISCTAYSPLGAGDRPARHRTVDNEAAVILEEPLVKNIAKKHGVTPAQVLIRYMLQLDLIVLPKTSRLGRLEENFKVFEFELDKSDTCLLKSLDRGLRFFVFKAFQSHPNFTKTNEPF